MIDLHVRDEDALLKLDSSDYVKDIVNLFLYNYFVTNPSSVVVREKIATNPELEMISKKNESLCKEVLKKTIGIINSDCDGAAKRMTEGDKALVSVSVGMVLDGQDMGEVLEMFN